MAEGSGGLGHLVTPADRLARIAHDPQHVGERQFAGYGCFLPHLLVCTAGRSLGAASARPFSTVSVHRAVALQPNRGDVRRFPVHLYHNTAHRPTLSAVTIPIVWLLRGGGQKKTQTRFLGLISRDSYPP